MKRRQHGFSAVEIILVVLVVALMGGLGWMFYDRMQAQDDKTDQDQTKKAEKKESTKSDVCSGGDEAASSGVFCAEDVGVKVNVPDAFIGKFKKIDNYDVMTQQSLNGESTIFGKSIVAYQAEFKDGKATRSMVIAKEPLRTFKVRSSTPAFFDHTTLQIVNWERKEVSSVDIDGKKFYTYGVGDAGIYSDTYAGVTGDHLTVISFSSEEQLGPDGGEGKEFDLDTVKEQFNSRTKALDLL